MVGPSMPPPDSFGPAVQLNGWEKKAFYPPVDTTFSILKAVTLTFLGMAASRINPFFPWSHLGNKGPFKYYVLRCFGGIF